MKDDWEGGRAYVAERVDDLKKRPWPELEQLPAYVELTPPGLEGMKFGQWIDKRADGSLRIVVQQYRPGLIAGKMAAEGFVVHPDGRVAPVPEDEMWEYT